MEAGAVEERRNVSPALVGAGYQVIAMDCRGRGRSAWDDVPITFELMTDDALGLLDHLGIDTFQLAGWSDSGVIGLELAINHAERLQRAVLYAAHYSVDGFYDEPILIDQVPLVREPGRRLPAAVARAGALRRDPECARDHVVGFDGR